MNVAIRNNTKLIWRKSIGFFSVTKDIIDGITPQYTSFKSVADLPCSEKSLKSSIGLVDKT